MNAIVMETALGLCASRGSRTIDVGAGVQDGLLVVADGMGGHCTGWLGARLAVRTLCERFANEGSDGRFVGGVDKFPDNWGWAGGMQSSESGESIYNEICANFGAIAALPKDITAMFGEIDRVIANIPKHTRINGLTTGCIAATIEGSHIHGAHVGIGRVLVLRAGSRQFESIVIEHLLHLVYERMNRHGDLDLSSLPKNVIVNSLGMLTYCGVGIDSFDIDLQSGDILLLCSRELDIPEDELAVLVRTAVDEKVSLEQLARLIERNAAERFDEANAYTAKDVAFTLTLAR